MLISQYVTLFIIPVGFVFSYFNLLPISLVQSIAGACFGYGLLWLIARVFYVITGIQGMGEGDFELQGLIGAFLGVSGAWYSLMGASILGAVVGMGMMFLGKADRTTRIPFGPFLALAGILLVLLKIVPAFSNFN
jgi:leader peptidase (prepilin peptidase)/N-methyltransferase